MTKIEWVKNVDGTQGKTWSPVTGCSKRSAGCANCWAERMALDAGDPSMEGMELHAEPEWTQTCQPLNYVIAGGESGHGARIMPIQAARSLRDQCNEAGIPFLFKQHGMYLHTSQMVRGVHFGENESRPTGDHYVKCTSKHWAGRLLDGVIHDDMPLMIKS